MGARARTAAGTGIFLVVAACAGPGAAPSTTVPSATATVESTPSPQPTPTLAPAEAILAVCDDAPEPEGDEVVLHLRANSSGFNTDRLDGARHCEPFTIVFTNACAGDCLHNVAIEPLELVGVSLFPGELIGKGQTEYHIPPLPAGEYRFLCSPHRQFMRGTLEVSEA